ncbi:MAG: isochorismatase family protein [Rhodocyclaceae bacterium]|nr:isochorismatase family protein [Rhodocyclaceae bacterium]
MLYRREFNSSLAPYYAVRETPLLEHLRDAGISRLVIAGMMTHMCIDTTTRAAADLGFSCVLAHDACATRALSFNSVEVPAASVQAAYLAALNGLFAKVRPASELCADL